MAEPYRPWGPLQWIEGKLPGGRWSLLGTLGTEDRCTSVFSRMNQKCQNQTFLKIMDPHVASKSQFVARHREIERLLVDFGMNPDNDLEEVNLLEEIDAVENTVNKFKEASMTKVLLDISSMPKRWFFPVLRFLLSDDSVHTLVVCYSVAASYSDQLSSDPSPIAPLPTFGLSDVEESYDNLIIGVGFAPLGLKELFEWDIGRVRYLFPFPPGPPNYFRNWDFLRKLEKEDVRR